MIHARPDYQRFQDPALSDPSLLGDGSTPIAADEPVMLFRAKDKHFRRVLLAYRDLISEDDGMDPVQQDRMLAMIDDQIWRAKKWIDKHGNKRPDVPNPGSPAAEEVTDHV